MEKIIALILVFLLTFCIAPALAENITIGAKVAEIDKYGQAQLDISKADFTGAGFDLGDIVTVTCESYIGDIVAQYLRSLVKHSLSLRILFAELLCHAHILRALSRK